MMAPTTEKWTGAESARKRGRMELLGAAALALGLLAATVGSGGATKAGANPPRDALSVVKIDDRAVAETKFILFEVDFDGSLPCLAACSAAFTGGSENRPTPTALKESNILFLNHSSEKEDARAVSDQTVLQLDVACSSPVRGQGACRPSSSAIHFAIGTGSSAQSTGNGANIMAPTAERGVVALQAPLFKVAFLPEKAPGSVPSVGGKAFVNALLSCATAVGARALVKALVARVG